VLSGRMTKAEGARRLGLSRSYFQSVCNRVAAEMAKSLVQGSPGRPGMSERERRLQEENRELSRQNARQKLELEQQRVAIEALSHALRERRSARPVERDDSEDSEVADSRHFAAVQMHLHGLRLVVIALVLGLATRTLRRYVARARAGEPLVNRRGPGPASSPGEDVVALVEHEVRGSRGLMGAACLAVKTGTSRRQAAAIKDRVLTEMERERKAGSLSVRVSEPGVMRSFDQLYVTVDGWMRVLLICADACVPYRTTIALVESYDSVSVASVIELDISLHGVPYFWRMDRASPHMTDEVLGVLDERSVLPLFGPPRHPGFYGQMERMNNEHRSWLAAGPDLTTGNIGHELYEMRMVLNNEVVRPILGYRTSAAIWGERQPPQLDRHELKQEVSDTAAMIYGEVVDDRDAELLSWRRAIERVMIAKGLMTIGRGAWC
jgi:hypothetical protein